jgi:hypothetical protein
MSLVQPVVEEAMNQKTNALVLAALRTKQALEPPKIPTKRAEDRDRWEKDKKKRKKARKSKKANRRK